MEAGQAAKHLSEVWNIAFPNGESNGSSLMSVSDVHQCVPKESIPKHEDGSTYNNQSHNSEINQPFSLEEKDRSMTELIVSDCPQIKAGGLNLNEDNVSDSCIISPQFKNKSAPCKQLLKKQSSLDLSDVKDGEYFTGSQTVTAPLYSLKQRVHDNSTVNSKDEAFQIFSVHLQDEYTCSTPKEKHNYSHPSSKYVVSPEISCVTAGGKLEESFREAPDGGEKQASNGQIDPGQVQVFLTQEQTSINDSSHIRVHANELAFRLMMQKTSSNSSSDFMDKLSLIDVEKHGLDSLLSIPSLGPSHADQAGQKPDISPIIEGIKNSFTDLTENRHENRDDTGSNCAREVNEGFDDKNACASENAGKNDERNNLPLPKKSRIPKLVQKKINLSCASTNINHSSNGSFNDSLRSKSVSNSRSFSSDNLPSHMFSSHSNSVSLLSSAPSRHIDKSSSPQLNKNLGQRCLSALALDGGLQVTPGDQKRKSNQPSSYLNRSSSVSMCSLPSSQKLASYTHVQSKVKQYIHDIKASRSRLASPSRSDTNSPIKTPTSSGPGNSIYLLNEDFLNETDGALPVELQSLVRQLEGASGDPRVLRTLFRVLLNERQTRSEHEHTLAAMQLSYDNLLAAHARSQNLIDELRLQMTARNDGSRERVHRPGFASVNASRAPSPLHHQRRHSVAVQGQGPTLGSGGHLEGLSHSQPNLIKETTRHVTETNLGISFDESGSMFLFPTPFESDNAIALLTADESVKSGTTMTNERENTSTSLNSHVDKYQFSPENYNDESNVSESSHISNARLASSLDKLNSKQTNHPLQTCSKPEAPISVSDHPLNVSATSASGISAQTKENVLLGEIMNKTSLKQPQASLVATSQSNFIKLEPNNVIRNPTTNSRPIHATSGMSPLSESSSWGTLRTKLKDLATLLSCGALTEQETTAVWAEMVILHNRLVEAVGGSEAAPMGAAMQLLAIKFGLNPPRVRQMTSVEVNKTQPPVNSSSMSTTKMADSRAAPEKSLNRGVIKTQGQGLHDPKWSDCRPELYTVQTASRGEDDDRFSRLGPGEKRQFNETLVPKSKVKTTTFDGRLVPQCTTSDQTAIDTNDEEGSKEAGGGVSAVPNYFTSFSAHDVSDNERLSETVQVPELDSIYTVNEDSSSLSAEDYAKYISVLNRLHWKLSRQESLSKAKNRVSAEPKTDYLSKIRSLNERIEQLCNERNGSNMRSSTTLKPFIPNETDYYKPEPCSLQKPEGITGMTKRLECHEGHNDSSTPSAEKRPVLTREAFVSNDNLSPVSAREKVELWREGLVASVTDTETDNSSSSVTADRNPFVQGQNSKQEITHSVEQKSSEKPITATIGGTACKSFNSPSEKRNSVGEPRISDNGALSKRFDLDSGCPVSDRSFRHFASPHIKPNHCGLSGSEKSATDFDVPHHNAKPDDSNVCTPQLNMSQYNRLNIIKPFVEENYPHANSPLKTVANGNQLRARETAFSNVRHQPMHGTDQSIGASDDRSQTSAVTGNGKTCDKSVHETLLKLQRDVDLMKSNFQVRTVSSGKTGSRVRHRRNLTDERSPAERLSRANRTPVRAVIAYPPSTSDSDAESFVQEGHGGGVRRRTRRSEGISTKRMLNSSGASHKVPLSPRDTLGSCKSCFSHSDNVDARDSTNSRVYSSPRLIRKRKKRSYSCPRSVPVRSSRSTLADNQPTCHCGPELESDSRPRRKHPSLPLLSDTCHRCRLHGQQVPTAPLSHRESPLHQLCTSPLQFLQRSSSCRDLQPCNGVGCGSSRQSYNDVNARTGSSLRSGNGVYPGTPNVYGPRRRWKSDSDFNRAKVDQYMLANHSCIPCNDLVNQTKSCTCDICRGYLYGKGHTSCSSSDNCKPCCGINDNLWLSLDTATALADSVHARSRCLLLALRSRTPTRGKVVPDDRVSAPSLPTQTDDIAVTCTDKAVNICDVVIDMDPE